MNLSVSVIIPTLNEAENILHLLNYLKELDINLELIVADGNSTDNTVSVARQLCQVVSSSPGRGIQMNTGARAATGDVYWFIHADCRPHPDSLRAMKEILRDANIAGGGFEYSLDHPGFRFRLVEFLSNRKNRLLNWLFGDMGIFVRRDIFEAMGGYKQIPLMEDMDFSKRLKNYGKIVILPQRMQTSARRWIEEGYTLNAIRSWTLQSAWSLGASEDLLARFYKFK